MLVSPFLSSPPKLSPFQFVHINSSPLYPTRRFRFQWRPMSPRFTSLLLSQVNSVSCFNEGFMIHSDEIKEIEGRHMPVDLCIINQNLPPSLTFKEGFDKLKEAIEELKINLPSSRSGLIQFQVLVPPCAKALDWFCSQDREIPFYPHFYFSSDQTNEMLRVSSFGRAICVHGSSSLLKGYHLLSRYLSINALTVQAYGFSGLNLNKESSLLQEQHESFYLFVPQIELRELDGCSLLAATLIWDDYFSYSLDKAFNSLGSCFNQMVNFISSRSIYERKDWLSNNCSKQKNCAQQNVMNAKKTQLVYLNAEILAGLDNARDKCMQKELLSSCECYFRASQTCTFSSNMGFDLDKCDLSIKECSNVNFVWASLIIEELVRLGVTYYCIAPGSRSTPLAISATRHPLTNCISCYDERSLAFNALGYARGSHVPAVVITSSGTAVSNLYPAVVEASQDFVPIIVLTADRPPELLDCGANQAIDQVNHFGKYVRHFSNLPPPTDQIPSKIVLTTIDSSVYHCYQSPGPVHINCQFRDPLHNSPLTWSTVCLTGLDRWLTSKNPYTKYINPRNTNLNLNSSIGGTDCGAMLEVIEIIKRANKGMLVIGEVCNETGMWGLVFLVRQLAWPVVVDVLSGLRIRRVFSSFLENVCFVDHMDHALLSDNFVKWAKPDVILQIGGRITSKRVSQFLESCAPFPYILVDSHLCRHDPSHIVTYRIQCTITEFVSTLSKFNFPKKDESTRWTSVLRELNSAVAREIEFQINSETSITEPYISTIIGQTLGTGTDTALFIGNSMVIRDLDMYAKGCIKSMKHGVNSVIYEKLGFHGVRVAGNRGASGIDGLLSSAIGFAAGTNKKVFCMVGDVSFLHDTNGLSLLNHKLGRKPITIIVVNNHGGAIFSLLPVASKTKPDILNKFFYTAHDISLSHLCSAHSVKHVLVQTKLDLKNALKEFNNGDNDSVIEVVSSISSNAEFHRILRESVSQVVNQAMGIIVTQSDDQENITSISRIQNAEYASFRIKLSAPPTSSEIKDEKHLLREGIILKVTLDDQSIGFGEVMPIEIHEESLSDAEAQIRFVVERLKGCKIDNFLPLLNGSFSHWIWRNICVPPFSIFPTVRCGIEMAVLNAIAAHQETSLCDLLLGTIRSSNDANKLEIIKDYSMRNKECIKICALVDCEGSPIEVANFVSNLVDEGFRAVKLKVARRKTPIEDAMVIHKIREIVGYKIDIRVDANRRWTYEEAMQFGSIVKKCNLQYIEEPIQPKYDIIKFCEASGLPVALDETIDDIKGNFINNLQKYVHPGIVAIVIKPSRVGGFENTALIANWAHINNKMAVISSAYESNLSLSTYAQLSYFLQVQNEKICKIRNMCFNGGIIHGLGTYKWIKEDIVDQRLNICLQPNEEIIGVSMKDAHDFIEKFCWDNERILCEVCYNEEIRSFFVKVGNGDKLSCLVRYQEAGSSTNKNKVIFLHGFLGTSEDWIPIMKSLSTNINSISIDLPGHGKSQINCNNSDEILISVESTSNLLHKLINKITSYGEEVVLVGYSMGARIALQMILNSDKIKGAVIISGNAGLKNESNKSTRHKVDKSRAQMLLSLGLNKFLESWYSSKLWASLREHAYFDRIVQSRTQHDNIEALAKILCDSSIGNQRSLWEDLGSLKKPLLIIAGEKDSKFKDISYQIHKEIMKSSKDKNDMGKLSSEVVIIPHCGHAVHLENPLSLMHAITKFLSKLDGDVVT